MERQDTPLFLTGSERKVNLASLKMAFFFGRVRRREEPPPLSAAFQTCEISRKAGFFLFSGLLAGSLESRSSSSGMLDTRTRRERISLAPGNPFV